MGAVCLTVFICDLGIVCNDVGQSSDLHRVRACVNTSYTVLRSYNTVVVDPGISLFLKR